MKAVTAALASGVITPGEAGRIAVVVDTFVQAIETRDFEQRLTAMEQKARRSAEARSYPSANFNY
jgi:hypothetical protein